MLPLRTSTVDALPHDPVGIAAAELVAELLGQVVVELHYTPVGATEGPRPESRVGPVLAAATLPVPDGWTTTLTIRLGEHVPPLLADGRSRAEPLVELPAAALVGSRAFRDVLDADGQLTPSLRRALRDSVVVEFLGRQHEAGSDDPGGAGRDTRRLIADTLEYLIELGGTRVESHNLTHGVVISDVFDDEPRLSVPYPEGLRGAKRSPLLFDGQRAVLVVDRAGRARTELQRHRLDRLLTSPARLGSDASTWIDSGSLVALATRNLGGIGFFLREDRSIWTFLGGRPLVIRRGEHWTAFPQWLASAVGEAIGGGRAVDLIVAAALMISGQPNGAILAIVDDTHSLEGTVEPKDRFDLRDEFDPTAMRPETRLHHLIDAVDMDAQTLARLASLDGATVVDRDGCLIAYGAIVSSSDSEHEGARTAAARTLSQTALAVLKVSEDGEITLFREGDVVATLLRSGSAAMSI